MSLSQTGEFLVDAPIAAVCFDDFEELLWVGTVDGHVTSYIFPEVTLHSSFHVAQGPVRGILAEEDGVLIYAEDRLRFHQRGGAVTALLKCSPSFSAEQPIVDVARSPVNETTFILGGEGNVIQAVDLSYNQFQEPMTLSAGCSSLAVGRFVCVGQEDGTVSLRDPNTLREEAVVPILPRGVVSDLDVQGNTLVVSGLIEQYDGQMYDEQYVHVYDLRYNREMQKIQCPGGATKLKFHPKFSSTVGTMSSQGQFSLLDTQGGLSASEQYMLEIDVGVEATTFDICSGGNMWSFGDGSGIVHQWGVDDSNM